MPLLKTDIEFARVGEVSLTLDACVPERALSGLVMDGSSGVPLEGATVTLQDAGLVATTDAAGRYRFEGKPAAEEAPVSQDLFDGDLSKQSGDRAPLSRAASADVITFSKDGYGSVSRKVNSIDGTEDVVLTLEGKVTYVCTTADAKGRWQIARTVYDPETKTSGITYLTDTAQWNFKPNFSPDGSRMTFFRRYAANGPCCDTWLSSICVMKADGSGLHEITAREESFHTEPYWARDGSGRIAYQKWVDSNHNMYKGGVMVYAKFDASVPSITDEVIFDQLDRSTMAWYVSISTDNKFLLFAKDGAIMQHDVEKGTTMKVSADSDPYKANPTYTTFSK